MNLEILEFKGVRTISAEDFKFSFDFTLSTETTDQPTVSIKSLSTEAILTLEFSKPVYEIEEPDIFVDPAVLQLEILSPFDIYDPETMLEGWKTLSMSENEI